MQSSKHLSDEIGKITQIKVSRISLNGAWMWWGVEEKVQKAIFDMRTLRLKSNEYMYTVSCLLQGFYDLFFPLRSSVFFFVGQQGLKGESLEMFCCQMLAETVEYVPSFLPTMNCTQFYAIIHGHVKQSACDVMYKGPFKCTHFSS